MKTGSQIRTEILEESKDSGYDYSICEDAILADCADDEMVAYNLYMARLTGVCSVSNVCYKGGY